MSYSSIDEIARDFEKRTRPSLFKKAVRHWKGVLAAGLVGTLLGSAVLYDSIQTTEQEVAEVTREMSKTPVDPWWDQDTLEVKNNIVDLTVNASNSFRNDYRTHFPFKNGALYVDPGERVDITVSLNRKQPEDVRFDVYDLWWPVKVYVEGYSGDEFTLLPREKNLNDEEVGMGTSDFQSVNIDVPEDLRPGTYVIATEVYSPSSEEVVKQMQRSLGKELDFRLPDESVVVARKRIPMVIGDRDLSVDIGDTDLDDYNDSLNVDLWDPVPHAGRDVVGSFSRLSRGEVKRFVIESSVSGYEGIYRWVYDPNEDSRWDIHDLPKPNRPSKENFIVSCKDGDNEVVWKTYLPLESYSTEESDTHSRRSYFIRRDREDAREIRHSFIERLKFRARATLYSAFPSLLDKQIEDAFGEHRYWWKFRVPERDFSDQLENLRIERFGDDGTDLHVSVTNMYSRR